VEISLTIGQAVQITGLSRSRIYVLLGEGMLESRKAGRRTLILNASLRAYINNLPSAEIRRAKTTKCNAT
jgi:hypothetical protein